MDDTNGKTPDEPFDPKALWQDEKSVLECVREGRWKHFPDQGNKPKAEIRAAFIRHLMLQLPVGEDGPLAIAPGGVRVYAASPGETEGVMITGAVIKGSLNLSDGRSSSGGAMPVLALEFCEFQEGIVLEHAWLQRLSLQGSRVKDIWALGIRLEGPCDLSYIAPATVETGPERAVVNLANATINGDFNLVEARLGCPAVKPAPRGALVTIGVTVSGDLNLRGASLVNRRKYALLAERMKIGGACFLDEGFKAIGSVSFIGATIEGAFQALNCRFINPGRNALDASGVTIKGICFLHDGFRASGEVSLHGATISGSLECQGTFTNRKSYAIEGHAATVGGTCFLRGDYRGEISFNGSAINGSFYAGGGRFSNPGNFALTMANATIGIDCLIDHSCQFDGKIQLSGTRIAQTLAIATKNADKREWFLNDTTTNRLNDSEGNGWGKGSQISADGFRYEFLDIKNPRDAWPARRRWLKQHLEWNPNLGPQPYEQIARVLANMGHADAARSALVHQIKREMGGKRPPANPLTWPGWAAVTIPPLFLQWLFGLGFRFGYSPGRALITVALLIVLGNWGTYYARDKGLLIVATQPVADVVLPNKHQFATSLATAGAEERTRCKGTVAPLLYAVDTLVPIVDLGEEKKCEPGQVNPPDHEPKVFGRELDLDGVLRGIKAFYALLGAVATSLLVLTFSGVLRKKLD